MQKNEISIWNEKNRLGERRRDKADEGALLDEQVSSKQLNPKSFPSRGRALIPLALIKLSGFFCISLGVPLVNRRRRRWGMLTAQNAVFHLDVSYLDQVEGIIAEFF